MSLVKVQCNPWVKSEPRQLRRKTVFDRHSQNVPKMDHFIDTKIPKMSIFVDKNSQNDLTPFPKVVLKTPVLSMLQYLRCLIVHSVPCWLNLGISG